MSTTIKGLAFGGAVALALAALVALMFSAQARFAGADAGPASEIASSSTMQIGPQEVKTLFAAATASPGVGVCANRIVSTQASAVMLSFHSSITPSATAGHLQGASTTKEYLASQYGCGAVTAYGFASSTVTKTEAR